MALIVKNYELPDGLILEAAYFKIKTVNISNSEYEHLKPSNVPGFDLESEFINRIESFANVFVYGDNVARKNGVAPVHWFPINFTYNLSEWSNAFEQAYLKLKEIYPESEDC